MISNKTASAIVEAIRRLIIEKHGIPDRIITYNGLEFANKEVDKLAKEFNIDWKFSSPEHHNTVGAVERANQSLMNILKKLTNFGQLSWKRHLENATTALNHAYNRSIGTSPYILRNSKLPLFPIDQKVHQKDIKFSASELVNERDANFDKYKKAIVKGKIQIKTDFKVGDKVLVYKPNPVGKFSCNWEPGYTIEEVIKPDAYLVTRNQKRFRLNKKSVKLDTSIGGRGVARGYSL